ncbi:MAG: hypothetical protein QNJ81_00135 [Acidimicrobiia bacterium]|nr:hypothetical protein [Acidimicrobiia bacterium]
MTITELLGLDDLLAQMILAVGAAMVIGNGFAIFQHSRGKHPKGASGEFRAGRAWWFVAVGLLITLWGVGSLLTR